MIDLGDEFLLPACVSRPRLGAANISADDLRSAAQHLQGPNQIRYSKASTLPVCRGLLRPQTIQINRDINRRGRDLLHEGGKTLPPVFRLNRSAAVPIRGRSIVRPWMHIEAAGSFRGAITKCLSRPPALEIAATPDAH